MEAAPPHTSNSVRATSSTLATSSSTHTTTSAQTTPEPIQTTKLQPLRAGPAAAQLEWVVAALNRGSAPSEAELAQHFSAPFLHALAQEGGVAAFAPIVAQAPLGIAGVLASKGEFALQAELTASEGVTLSAAIAVSPAAPHLIEGLLFTPLSSPITSWSGVDQALQRLAPHASLYAGYAGGGELHALNGTEAGAIGSAFKLYVLGALADAVAHSRVHWNTLLAIHEDWKSLPSGNMRLEPAGTKFTLLHYAQQMISVSDNTAADHLIHLLGRGAVEAQLTALGNHSAARDTPFLTTRELFALKLAAPASLSDEFAAAGSSKREQLLPRVDSLTPTLAQASSWTTPRLIDTIEWFASPSDLATAIGRLEADSQPGLAPVRQILAINPGIELDRSTWTYVGYKGGSEPGVLSLTWYLRRRVGRAFVLSIILNDPKQAISELAPVSIAQAAIALLARAA